MKDRILSVVIPAFNAESFLDRAVESAISLQIPGMEIIIAEDGSKDDTLHKANRWVHRNPGQIVVVQHRHGRNMGAGATRNLAIRCAKGRYIGFLDADDYYIKEQWLNAFDFLKNHPNIDGVFGSVETRHIGTPELDFVWPTSDIFGQSNLIKAMLIEKPCLWHANAFICRKSIFEKIGLFREDISIGEDRDFWLKVLLASNVSSILDDRPVAIVTRGHDFHTWTPNLTNDLIRDLLSNIDIQEWLKLHTEIANPQSEDIIESAVFQSAVLAVKALRQSREWIRLVQFLYILLKRKPILLFNRSVAGNALYGLLLKPQKYT